MLTSAFLCPDSRSKWLISHSADGFVWVQQQQPCVWGHDHTVTTDLSPQHVSNKNIILNCRHLYSNCFKSRKPCVQDTQEFQRRIYTVLDNTLDCVWRGCCCYLGVIGHSPLTFYFLSCGNNTVMLHVHSHSSGMLQSLSKLQFRIQYNTLCFSSTILKLQLETSPIYKVSMKDYP